VLRAAGAVAHRVDIPGVRRDPSPTRLFADPIEDRFFVAVRQPHTVSRVYLARFAIPSGRRPKLHVLDLDRGIWLPATTPSKVARIRDMYRIEGAAEKGVDPDLVEEALFGKLESTLPAILDHIDRFLANPEGTPQLPDEQLSLLIAFVAAQYVRTAARREVVDSLADVLARTLLDQASPDPETWEEHRKRAASAGVPVRSLSFESVRRTVSESHGSEIKFTLHQNRYLRNIVDAWAALAEALAGKTWALVVPEHPDTRFITSDDPVALFRRARSRADAGDGALYRCDPRTDDAGCAIALSPHVLLVGAKNFPPGVHVAGPRRVAAWNTALAIPDRRWIFTATPDFTWLDADGSIRPARDLVDRARSTRAASLQLRKDVEADVRAKFNQMLDRDDSERVGDGADAMTAPSPHDDDTRST
jgi:hypothetical protein